MVIDEDRDQERESGVAALWRLARQGGAPRAGLSLPDIVAAAVAIADEQGLGEVSMARVAKRLGFSTMALYRHVPNKGELLTLMFDAGVGTPPAAILAATGWRARMHVLGQCYLDMFMRRPWLLDIPITGPPLGPNNIAWLNTGLTILEATGLEPADRLEIFMVVSSYLLGSVRLAVEMARAAEAAARSGRALPDAAGYGIKLRGLLPAGRYPAVEAVLAAGVFDDGDDDGAAELQRGLDTILDGVEARMAKRGATGRS